jgi:hypothetical protein
MLPKHAFRAYIAYAEHKNREIQPNWRIELSYDIPNSLLDDCNILAETCCTRRSFASIPEMRMVG